MATSTVVCLGLVLCLGVIPSRGFCPSNGAKLVRSRFPHEANRWCLRMASVLKEGDVFWAKELRKGMHYRQLGKSDLVVSEVCLGTMTWGEQNSDEEAFDQLNLAYDEFGVNFIDTAEIYPVPTKAETQGRTELALGKWLKTRTRHDVVVATKVAGRSDRLTYLRDSGEGTRVRRKDILEAVDKSLKRLGTDYIDLLQVHWPDRNVPMFGANGRYDVTKERDDDIPFEEQLAALDEVVKAGKVRFIGTSNDTPYGVAKMAQIGERMGYPRVASVQNNYSLLVRADTELGSMPEAVSRQNTDVGFLAYSPLAGGVLTGKYENAEEPMPDARLNRFEGFMGRYLNSDSSKAVRKYAEIADMIGLTPTQLALAWVYSREFITSTVIGATNVVQLRDNLRALNCPVTQPAYEAIHKVYDEFRDPTKQKR